MEKFRRRGFTLIELMLVVAIIGLLAAIAVPKFADLVDNAREASLKSYLGNIRYAQRMYYIENEGVSPAVIPFAWSDPNFGIYRYIDKDKIYGKIPTLPRSIKGNHASSAYFSAQNVSFFFPMVVDDDPRIAYYFNTDTKVGQIVFSCTHVDRKGMIWSKN